MLARKNTLLSFLIQTAFWTFVALFNAISSMLESPFNPSSTPPKFWIVFKEHLIGWYSWGILTPLVIYLARTFSLKVEYQRWRNVWMHVVFGASLSAVDYWFYLLLSSMVIFQIPDAERAWFNFHRYLAFISGFGMMNLCYWLTIAFIHAIDFYKDVQAEKLRNADLQAKLMQAELSALKMQLQPHFLFNTLNSISSLLYQDIAAADKMISLLGDFLRMTLKCSFSQTTSLDAELRFLNAYLEIERVRFQNRLSISFEVPPDTTDAEVPSLILQPIVENALKHGFSQTLSGGMISIKVAKRQERLTIIIHDNGVGWASPTPNQDGIGLLNTRERLAKMYGTSASLFIRSAPEHGTSVTIELPFISANSAIGHSSASNLNRFR